MPFAPLFLPLANAALPDPAGFQSVGWILLALAALAAAANQILGLIEKFRGPLPAPQHPITEDRVKALETRVHSIELKIESHFGAIQSQFHSISQTLTNLQSDWNYAIGRIDGRNE